MTLAIRREVRIPTRSLKFEFDDGRVPEETPFAIDDVRLPLLHAFVSEALVLEEIVRALGTNPVSVSISARVGEATKVSSRVPSRMELSALLHHLRPFVLEEEPYSFYKVRKWLGASSESAVLKAWLKQIKRRFEGQTIRDQMVISSATAIINSEGTLKQWLNAKEYHRDADRKEQLATSVGIAPVDISEPVFVMLIYQKAVAVLHLANLVVSMVGQPPGSGARDG